jgi:tight adherence protein B
MASRLGRPAPAGDAAERAAELVERLATLLAVGVQPGSAWEYLDEFSAHPLARRVTGTMRLGMGATEAVGAACEGRRSEPSAAVLGAIWCVADAAGAPLAPALAELAAALRDLAEIEREVDVALAGPRATGRLVGWLPLAGLALAGLIGVDPLGALTGSVVGWSLLVSGAVLLAGGRVWTVALTRRAAPSGAFSGIRHELLAVALAGGLPISRARELTERAAQRFGLAGSPDAVEPVLRLAERAGAPAGELLRSAGRHDRREERTEGRRAAARLGVRLMLPLGVCVLPSFMVLGVAPVVLAIVSSTLGST